MLLPAETEFELGRVLVTQGVRQWMRDHGFNPWPYIRKHSKGNFGDVDDADWKRNQRAIENGTRILSSYETRHGTLWIITEAGRHATTCLRPREY